MIKKINKFELINSKILSSEEMNLEFLNNPYANYILYIDDNEVIGYVYYSIIYDRIEINQVEVKLKMRRKKIASKMLDFLIKNETVNNISLEVRENNFPAINLYKKFNFNQVAVREKYYNGINGILMIRDKKDSR